MSNDPTGAQPVPQRDAMEKQPNCPRCGQPMVEGYIPELSQAHTGRLRWIAGPPNVGFLGLNMRGRDVIEVRTFRCPGCGCLESYAWK